MNKNNSSVIAICGPTCTHKSKIAIELAKKYPIEIISADSRLIYKYMDIGTCKPSVSEMEGIPHHMIDIVEPNEEFSVGNYKSQVEKIILEIQAKDKMPLLVGGTGLYLNAVLGGLSIPKVESDKEYRESVKNIPQMELHFKLKKLDPEAAKKIHENDNFRTVRALEVIEKTGELFSRQKKIHDLPFEVKWIGINYKDVSVHNEKIKQRTSSFCNEGFFKEVESLLKKYGELEIFKNTIGYNEAIKYLKNEINKEELIEEIFINTRQYAKRQRTWFKANKKINWLYLDENDSDLGNLIETFLQ